MHNDKPGVLLLTPFKVKAPSPFYILVQRGFIPIKYADISERKKFFWRKKEAEITAIVRKGQKPKYWLSPRDPDPQKLGKRVDKWLRVDIKKIQKQLPYRIAPVYLEIVPTTNPQKLIALFFQTEAGREELLLLTKRAVNFASADKLTDLSKYPVPQLSTELPPARHLGYVFEWLFLAFLVGGAAFLFTMRHTKNV
ncbi:MAG: hypothetical protein D6780_04625 [Candidatus Dadabacteria bacterium]|nr:MAG: hypothetical protein D6780_04625 [Candidatus Dadabacteria bacterium]